MIDFPKDISIDSCENFLEKLSDCKGDVLRMPVGTKKITFGGLASAIQSINTWSRTTENRVLFLSHSDKKDEIRDLIQRPHKFVAAMDSRSILKLENGEQVEVRKEVNAIAKSAIEKQGLSLNGQQLGRLCWFAFVDHSSKGFDRNFYIASGSSNPEPRQPEQFTAVIGSMVKKAMQVAAGAKPLNENNLEYLGRIFYELFLNTHEHGTRGQKRSEWLKPGVRIIYVQAINLNEAGARGVVQNQPVLKKYLQSVEKKHGMEKKKLFVEISIVDSGLGLCGRWLADRDSNNKTVNPSIEDEYSIFRKCFGFRQTSTLSDSKGLGLPSVMDRLTKLDALMRVRSGRLALYRDFMASPYQSSENSMFSDWKSGKSTDEELSSMPSVSGVSISLLIPLEAKE